MFLQDLHSNIFKLISIQNDMTNIYASNLHSNIFKLI